MNAGNMVQTIGSMNLRGCGPKCPSFARFVSIATDIDVGELNFMPIYGGETHLEPGSLVALL